MKFFVTSFVLFLFCIPLKAQSTLLGLDLGLYLTELKGQKYKKSISSRLTISRKKNKNAVFGGLSYSSAIYQRPNIYPSEYITTLTNIVFTLGDNFYFVDNNKLHFLLRIGISLGTESISTKYRRYLEKIHFTTLNPFLGTDIGYKFFQFNFRLGLDSYYMLFNEYQNLNRFFIQPYVGLTYVFPK